LKHYPVCSGVSEPPVLISTGPNKIRTYPQRGAKPHKGGGRYAKIYAEQEAGRFERLKKREKRPKTKIYFEASMPVKVYKPKLVL